MRASLAPDEPLAWHPALRANGVADDKSALLVPMVSRDLPSAEARDDERQLNRVCDLDDRETMFRSREHSAIQAAKSNLVWHRGENRKIPRA